MMGLEFTPDVGPFTRRLFIDWMRNEQKKVEILREALLKLRNNHNKTLPDSCKIIDGALARLEESYETKTEID